MQPGFAALPLSFFVPLPGECGVSATILLIQFQITSERVQQRSELAFIVGTEDRHCRPPLLSPLLIPDEAVAKSNSELGCLPLEGKVRRRGRRSGREAQLNRVRTIR